MKSLNLYIKKTIWGITTIALLLFWGCDLQETNINPNASSEVSISAVLTGAEVVLGFSLGVDAGLIANTYIQQTSGANGDATSFDTYTTSPNYLNSIWNNFYTNVLDELSIVKRTAAERQLPYYSGISRVLTVYAFATLTDLFGDIPYTEALAGNENVNPSYDSQETIYADLHRQLDSALLELSLPVSANLGALPAADDVIYRGDISKWIAATYTLKARLAIHQSKIDARGAAEKALGYLYDGDRYRGIQGYEDDAQVVFGSATTNANPYYQQNTNRPGWVGLSSSFVNLLNGNLPKDSNTETEGEFVDPRRSYFATQYPPGSGNYRGSVPGISGAFSLIGSYYGRATSPVVLLSYSEAKFLEAEARLILDSGDLAAAQEALAEAVNASFNKIIDDTSNPYATEEKRAAYIETKATLVGNFERDLETIITQKYLALFLQPEAWTDYRRTGYPDLPLAQNATHSANPNGQIPRRIPYPQNELSLNPNTPRGSTYQEERLWWDK